MNQVVRQESSNRFLLLFIRLLILNQCLVMAWKMTEFGSPVNAYFFTRGVEDSFLVKMDLAFSISLVVLSIFSFFDKLRFSLILISAFFLLLALFKVANNNTAFDYLAPYASSIRIALPMTGLLLCSSAEAVKNTGMTLTRIAVAMTFAVHGFECLEKNPVFIDLIIGTGLNVLNYGISEEVALVCLKMIGAVDIVVAILFLSRKLGWVALYMCFWGTLAAFSRLTSYGIEDGWHHTMLRLSNGGAPMLFFFWWQCKSSTENVT